MTSTNEKSTPQKLIFKEVKEKALKSGVGISQFSLNELDLQSLHFQYCCSGCWMTLVTQEQTKPKRENFKKKQKLNSFIHK